ncbi:MAG TPA: carboxypeptidase regulatory-like domain-containing protein, partial [Kofleriaceae bacterium]|nr:carboxypeptidase regulatory-like domain-containing protein [Kofleriaceae bacterium]
MRRIVAVGIGVVILAVALFAWRGCGSSNKHTSASSGSAAHTTSFGAKRGKDSGPTQPASLAGKVTRAADGAPVPNAVVSLAPAELMAMFIKSEMPTLVATTDANGLWKVPRVMPGAYVVAAMASGYLPGDGGKVTVAAGEQRDGVNMTLTAGGTIVHGTVADVGGGPIADARITAMKGDEMPDLSGHADLVTTTKADGTYEMTLPDGSFSLSATHDDYTQSHKRIELAGKPITVDFSLIPGAVLRGQVVTRDGGKPVPGALVRA